MIKQPEFERWYQHIQLSAPTGTCIEQLRSSPPVRRVQGRAKNVSGAYTSRKMGVTIQFESHKIEHLVRRFNAAWAVSFGHLVLT